ncbi:hypothetical protein G6F42_023223 [Rhizopus arrhizus]|nr:hypothetical protein G6F42_023223 [Rhizopus arrhizus]
MEVLHEKAQSLDKQFNYAITTARSSKNQFLILQCRHGGEYRKARKGQKEEQQQKKDEKEDEKDKRRDAQNPREVRQVILDHNHSLSNDMYTPMLVFYAEKRRNSKYCLESVVPESPQLSVKIKVLLMGVSQLLRCDERGTE